MIQAAKIIGSGLATIGLVGAGVGIGVVFIALTLGVGLGISGQAFLFGFISISPILISLMLYALLPGLLRIQNSLFIVKFYFLSLVGQEKLMFYFIILCKVIFIILYFYFSTETLFCIDDTQANLLSLQENLDYWQCDVIEAKRQLNESGLNSISNNNLTPDQHSEKLRLEEAIQGSSKNVSSCLKDISNFKQENQLLNPAGPELKRSFIQEGSENSSLKKR